MKMKKSLMAGLVCLAALGLAACTGNQKATTSASSKTSSTTSQSSTSSSSSSSKEEKQKQEETRKKYQEVLDRGALVMSEGAKGNDALYTAVDSQLPIGVNSSVKTAYENQMWKSSYSTSKGKLQYAFYDINKDGVEELLIGTPQEVNGLFSLHDDKPEFLLTGMFASAGGTQTKILILQDGTVIQSAIPGNDPEISATAYTISNGELQQQGQAGTYQEKTDQAAMASLGLTSPAVDLTKLIWEDFPASSAAASSSQEATSPSTASSDQAQPASTGMHC